MKQLSNFLTENRLKELVKHPRHKLLDILYKRVNAERIVEGFKRLPMAVYAIKTSHLSMDDLGYLVKKCQQSSNFGKCFWGLLKLKKDKVETSL